MEAPLPQVQIPQQSLLQMSDPLEQYNALASAPFPPEPVDRGSKDHMHKIRRHASREVGTSFKNSLLQIFHFCQLWAGSGKGTEDVCERQKYPPVLQHEPKTRDAASSVAGGYPC